MKYILLFSLFFINSFSLAEETLNTETATEKTDAQALFERGQEHITGFFSALMKEQIAIEEIKKGFSLLEESARLGHAWAQFDLGYLYAFGAVAIAFRGVGIEEIKNNNYPDRAEDIRRAEHWFEKAAKQGDAEIQYEVGTLYDRLYDESENLKHKQRAFFWLIKSADQGHPKAKAFMRYILNSKD